MMWTLLFPGQGSQSPGMGKYLYHEFSLVKELFEEASTVLSQDMKALCFEAKVEELSLTENTQPALLLVSTATQKVLHEVLGFQFAAAAGHSVGEYSALVAAGALRFDEALRAVRLRGQCMQKAVPVGKGGMAAIIGLNPEEVKDLCLRIQKELPLEVLSPANYNCSGQTVISGSMIALERLKKSMNEEGFYPKRFKMIPLSVSAPFHCELMRPAQEEMETFLRAMNWRKASFPIVQNHTARFHEESSELLFNLIEQISSPVLWAQSMMTLIESGKTRSVECGPGKVLHGLAQKIHPSLEVFSLNSLEDLAQLEKLHRLGVEGKG